MRTGIIGAVVLAAGGAASAAGPGGATESTPAEFPWPLLAWCLAAAAVAVLVRTVAWLRPSPRSGPAWPLRAEPSVLGFGAAFLASAAGAAAAGAIAGDGSSPLVRLAAVALGAHAGQLATVAVLFSAPALRARAAASTAGRGGVHPQPRGMVESLLMGAVAALLAWPLAQAAGGIAALVSSWIGPGAPALGHRTLEALSGSGAGDPWWWLTVAGAVVVGPVAEEFVYRGLLQQGLKASGMPAAGAIGITAALFAVAHWGSLTDGARAAGISTLVVLAVAWGVLYERTGRIAAPALAHALFNAANLWIAS